MAGYMEIETKYVQETDHNAGIAGWYVWQWDLTDWPSNPTWNDRGNGPEITDDHIHGPFSTEEGAVDFIRLFGQE